MGGTASSPGNPSRASPTCGKRRWPRKRGYLAFIQNLIRKKPEDVQRIANAVLNAIEFAKADPVAASETVAKYFVVDPTKYRAIREGAEFTDLTEKAKARDNCVFEAGFFFATLGPDRCFLVNGVRNIDLPSDLGGVVSLPFKEPLEA